MRAVIGLACLLIPCGLALQNGDFVELKRTGWPGYYTARIYADGRVLWHGTCYDWMPRWIAEPGDAESRVPAVDARKLIEQFRAKGFWTLHAEFPAYATDAPSAVTTLSVGPNRKQVTDNSSPDAPAWLRDLDDEIDSLADTHRWRHGDPRSERFCGPAMCGNLYEDASGPKPGVTPLMRAAGSIRTDAVKALLRSGANVNAWDASRWTALMYAADSPYYGVSTQIVELLLDAGADPRIRSFTGQTVLMAVNVSFSGGDEDAQDARNKVRALVAAGAEVNAQDQWGETALIQAVRGFRSPAKMQALLDAGARLDLRDRNGRTAIEELQSIEISKKDLTAKEKAMALLLRYQK